MLLIDVGTTLDTKAVNDAREWDRLMEQNEARKCQGGDRVVEHRKSGSWTWWALGYGELKIQVLDLVGLGLWRANGGRMPRER